MLTTTEVKSDGINVFITSTIHPESWVKFFLTSLNLALLIFCIWIMSNIGEEDIGKMLLPLLFMIVIFIFLPWRYWFWNMFGKEYIIINTKTITHYYDFGIIQTSPKTVHHFQLSITNEFVKTISDEEYGKIHFISHDSNTDLPEQVFQTSVLMSKKNILKICDKVAEIHDGTFNNNNSKFPDNW